MRAPASTPGTRVPRIEQPTVRNYLLSTLPPDDFARLVDALQPVTLALRQVLHEADERIGTVYFLEAGTASMTVTLGDGEGLEVGLVGRDGLVGLPVVLGTDIADTEATVQVPGTALCLRASALQEGLRAR